MLTVTGYAADGDIRCGDIRVEITPNFEYHEFDDSVDPEVDMEGVCIICGELIYW